MTPPGEVRIIVADDHQVVRDGFAELLNTQPDFTVIATASDGTEAVRLCGDLHPDVVLMDVRMPGDGWNRSHPPDRSHAATTAVPRILILTTFDLDEYVYDSLRAGASGFLLKDGTAGAALRRRTRDRSRRRPARTWRDSPAHQRVRLAAPPIEQTSTALRFLTPRETEVLRLVAEGLSNIEIAERLIVTEETVKTHVSRILSKLGLRDRTQAVVAAYESGLVVPHRNG